MNLHSQMKPIPLWPLNLHLNLMSTFESNICKKYFQINVQLHTLNMCDSFIVAESKSELESSNKLLLCIAAGVLYIGKRNFRPWIWLVCIDRLYIAVYLLRASS